MATHTQVTPDVEPTPEFDARCLNYVRGWQQGEIPSAEAIQNLKELSREAASSGHIANEARAEHLSGYIQHYIGNWNISIMHYDKARRYFDRVGNRLRVILMDINQGENYRYRGEFKRARRLYNQAYEAAAKLGDVRSQTIAITNEGLTLISMRDYHRAETALLRGLALSQEWEDSTNLEGLLTEVHFGLAQVALEKDEYELAWEQAHYSLDHARQGEHMHSVGLAYRILADVLTALGQAPSDSDFEKPDEYYRAAIETFQEIDAGAEIGRTIYAHALSCAKRNRRRHAAQLYRKAMVTFTRLGMTNDAAMAAESQLEVM